MARRPPERPGTPMEVRNRDVEFSFWPMARGNRRYGLQSRVFGSDPFNIIERSVNERCQQAVRSLALAYLEQARDFFAASQFGAVRAARPLLLYYAFMNLVKTFALTKGLVATFGDSHHGLTTVFPVTGSGPSGATLRAFRATPQKANLFDLLLRGLTGSGLPATTDYNLEQVLPQILLGHRLWCDAAGRKERFVEVEDIQFRDDRVTKECWVRFDLARSEYTRLNYTQDQIANNARLTPLWHIVAPSGDAQQTLRFEMLQPTRYNDRPSDVVNSLVEQIRHELWRSVTIVKPFRKYYIYVADPQDRVVPQLCAIYMVMFYLGSITRYRPDQFDGLVAGPYGAFIQEFIENQPNQWLYLLASEFAEQEIARAAVV